MNYKQVEITFWKSVLGRGILKDRCRDSMEVILTSGVKYVSRWIFLRKLPKEKEWGEGWTYITFVLNTILND